MKTNAMREPRDEGEAHAMIERSVDRRARTPRRRYPDRRARLRFSQGELLAGAIFAVTVLLFVAVTL